MKGTVNSVTPLSSGLGLNGRIALFWEYLNYTIVDVGPTSMMLNEFVRPVMADSKAIAVIGLPVLVLLLGIFFGRLRHDGLYIVAGLTLGLFVLVLVFGNRLWLHHYSPILPVLYVGLTIAIDRLVALYRHPTAADAVVVALLMPYGLANAASRQEVFTRLEATGGVGLSSDAIVRYAQDSLREPQSIVRVFPDWGLFMPFEMITRGLRPLVVADSPADSARSLLCSGRDVEVALITRSSDQRIDQWTEQIRWSMPTISHYNQRDGKSVLTVARWKSTNCADK
jgi:hypothetical protein